MIDYSNGGRMSAHNHSHNEDYTFVLYLNTCEDGETIVRSPYVNNPAIINPVNGRLLLMSSNIDHCANHSSSKRVLVGGLKIVNK
jgi:hypothetical protein